MNDPLLLLLGCDCDPDRPRYGGARYDVHRPAQQWHGISEGIRRLQQTLEGVERATGLKARVIFCVRSDLQMKELYGSAAWMLQEYLPLWRELAEQGHEIAWHPHLWRWSDKWGCWYQEIEDSSWICECLESGFSAFAAAWGSVPFTCHMGWTFHNDTSMKTISRFGLKIDFSASPGVYFQGGPGAAGTVFDNHIDWRGTPQKWYRPCGSDYRRPAGQDEEALDIFEVPKFTSSAGLLKTAKQLAYRARKGAGAQPAAAVFLQVTALPLLYNRLIQERLECKEADPFFATYFHPDELLEKKPVSAQSFLYSKAHMEKNLIAIIANARKQGRDVEFVTGPEAVEFVRAQL